MSGSLLYAVVSAGGQALRIDFFAFTDRFRASPLTRTFCCSNSHYGKRVEHRLGSDPRAHLGRLLQLGTWRGRGQALDATFLDEKSALQRGSPLGNVVAQRLLGSPEGVAAMRARIGACLRDRRFWAGSSSELAALSSLRSRPTLPQVVWAVAAGTDTTAQRSDRRHRRARGRAVAIDLANQLARRSQNKVGTAFGIGSFAVSKAVIEVSRAATRHGKLRG